MTSFHPNGLRLDNIGEEGKGGGGRGCRRVRGIMRSYGHKYILYFNQFKLRGLFRSVNCLSFLFNVYFSENIYFVMHFK